MSLSCVPCLFPLKRTKKSMYVELPGDRRRSLDDASTDMYRFGPVNHYDGEKRLINEHLYWIQYNKRRLVLGTGQVKTIRALSDVSEAMIQQSVLYCNVTAYGLANIMAFDYDNLEPYPYGLENVYGPVVDFETMRDAGYAITDADTLSCRYGTKEEIADFRKREHEWNYSHEAMARFHEIMCCLAYRLYEWNRLSISLNGNVYVAKGLFEYADSMAHFAVEYCKYGTYAQTVPIRLIQFDMWRMVKWNIKPAYFEKKLDSPRRTDVFVT